VESKTREKRRAKFFCFTSRLRGTIEQLQIFLAYLRGNDLKIKLPFFLILKKPVRILDNIYQFLDN